MTLNVGWAENEIRLAKKGAYWYTNAQLDAAYEAYKNLVETDRTGNMAIGVPEIINRLLERKPLTPIHNIPEEWEELWDIKSYKLYRSNRMLSLYKFVYEDGTVEVIDVNRVLFVDITTRDTIRSYLCFKALNRLYPIELPYYPPIGYFRVYGDLIDRANGIIKCHYLVEPGGSKVKLDKSNWIFYEEKEEK